MQTKRQWTEEEIKQRYEIGNFICLMRKREGLSQENLAECINTDRSTIIRLESGNKEISHFTFMQILKKLNIPISTQFTTILDTKKVGDVDNDLAKECLDLSTPKKIALLKFIKAMK